MKFETYYKKSLRHISKENLSQLGYNYELALYNHFVNSLIPEVSQHFIKSWRWNIQQNALKDKYCGKIHIKQLLTQIFDSLQLQLENNTSNIVSPLENDVLDQFKHLNEVTYDELAQEEGIL